jgi:signal transduction histidine kinase/CheY-like chemotaxis protein
MKMTLSMVIVSLLLMLLTWLSFSAINTQAELFDRALTALDDFGTMENALQRDVLTARAGMLRNYDSLVARESMLKVALDQLREVAAIDTGMAVAVDRLSVSATRQERLLESFKSDNALLQNSLAYFGLFSTRLATTDDDRALVPAVGALATAMLHLTLDTSSEAARLVEDRLNDVARLPLSPARSDSMQALLAHGRLLRDLLPTTDGVLRAFLAASGSDEQRTLRTLILRRQQASRATARDFRVTLYATSLLLLGGLVHLGVRLRRRTVALRQRAAIEHAIAGISTRLINVQSSEITTYIEQALAQLAECIGADRAYFMVSDTRTPLQGWRRKGVYFPANWPEKAPALARRFHPTSDGIIHVPQVDRLPPGVERDTLVAAGVHGWACVTRTGGDDIGGLLGFDLLESSLSRQYGGLGLLRMAFDAIANAVGRELLEREHERLEKRLQQARRMETIGALASGIAHNFNNIVGAILGYTEMAEAQVAPDNALARNLSEIRQSGERARDLVEQILTFGRRRDVRRAPTKVTALIAEAKSLLDASLPSQIELIVRESPSPATVLGEPEQLQQVIINLCNNASQAMDGRGRIEIGWEVTEVSRAMSLTHGEILPGRYVKISVTDAGRGMDEAIIEKIFDPFFTTRLAGNGLGLATVREIVLEHGGAIRVWSEPGTGSRFEIWLPCVAAAEPEADGDASTLPLGCGETVLVVDHEHQRLLRNEEMLAALGYEPVGFTRAEDALAACKAMPERFDALVVSCAVAASALDLAEKLNRLVPNLPIVLATPSAGEIDAEKLTVAGIREVVRRPFNSVEIAAALTRCLGRFQHARDSSWHSPRGRLALKSYS